MVIPTGVNDSIVKYGHGTYAFVVTDKYDPIQVCIVLDKDDLRSLQAQIERILSLEVKKVE